MDCKNYIEDCDCGECASVRSDTIVSRPTLRPDTPQDAPLAEQRASTRNKSVNVEIRAKVAAIDNRSLIAAGLDVALDMEEDLQTVRAAIVMELVDRLRGCPAVANGRTIEDCSHEIDFQDSLKDDD